MPEIMKTAIVLSFAGGIIGLLAGVTTALGWMLQGITFPAGYYWIAMAITILVGSVLVVFSAARAPNSMGVASAIVIVSSVLGTNILSLTGGILANRWQKSMGLALKVSLALGIGMFVVCVGAYTVGAVLNTAAVTPANILNGLWFSSLLGSITLIGVLFFIWLVPRYLGFKK